MRLFYFVFSSRLVCSFPTPPSSLSWIIRHPGGNLRANAGRRIVVAFGGTEHVIFELFASIDLSLSLCREFEAADVHQACLLNSSGERHPGCDMAGKRGVEDRGCVSGHGTGKTLKARLTMYRWEWPLGNLNPSSSSSWTNRTPKTPAVIAPANVEQPVFVALRGTKQKELLRTLVRTCLKTMNILEASRICVLDHLETDT